MRSGGQVIQKKTTGDMYNISIIIIVTHISNVVYTHLIKM